MFFPTKLLVQFLGQFRQDCNGCAKLEIAINSVEISFFGIAARDDEGRDIDVGVEDDIQNQRPSKTSFSTSDSVKSLLFWPKAVPYV